MKTLRVVVVLAIAVAALAGCSSGATRTADVVVIGGGGAGLAAANTAARQNAKVVLLEKMPFAGGATLLAAGSITGVGSKLHEDNGVQATVDDFAEELIAEGCFEFDEALSRVHAAKSGEAIDFMLGLGVEFFPEMERAPYRVKTKDPYQASFVQLAVDALKELGGEVLLNTKATEILTNKDGSVKGVLAVDSEGKKITIKAKAVVIATGDFSGNKDMLPEEYRQAVNFGPTSSTGDGIVMAQKVGAATTGMDEVALWGNGVEVAPGQGAYSWGRLLCQFGGIYVNTDGARFSKDVLDDEEVAVATYEQEKAGKTVWVVFNEGIHADLLGTGFPSSVSTWDAAKEAEQISAGKVIVKADSIEELAQKMNVPVEALTETVTAYNKAVKDQKDPTFGRTIFAKDLAEGPYYAMIQRLGIYPTVGGLKINSEAEVLDASGNPIKGLYAAGDVTGGVSTNGRDTLIPAVSFGLIAGENAAKVAK